MGGTHCHQIEALTMTMVAIQKPGTESAADGARAEQVVEPGILPDRREDAGGHGDQEAEEHGEDGQLEAHGQAAQDLVEDRLLGPERHAQVALQRLARHS